MADPADGFGGLPLVLQWAAAVGTVIGVAGAIVAGVRAKLKVGSEPPGRSAGPSVEWFFDGPVGKAIERLEGIYRESRQAREDQQRQADENNSKLDALIGEARQSNTLLGQIKDRLTQYQVNPPRRRP